MQKNLNYTEEEKKIALDVSLTQLARSMGYTPVRCGSGKHKLKEMDSLIIYNDTSYYRWSEQKGGSQIDFLMQFGGCRTVPEAVHALLGFAGYAGRAETGIQLRPQNMAQKPEKPEEKKPFALPEPAEDNRRVYAYLMKERMLSKEVIDYMVSRNLLYEEKLHHNCVFVGRDAGGKARYAALRGTGDAYGKKFKGDVTGNDKNYGVNIVREASAELNVFEACIDAMSYMDLTGDYQSNKLVLGMLSDHPLERFLKEYSHIRQICFRLDNDRPALQAVLGKRDPETGKLSGGLIEKYTKLGYKVTAAPAPDLGGTKDYNACLQFLVKKHTQEREHVQMETETMPGEKEENRARQHPGRRMAHGR